MINARQDKSIVKLVKHLALAQIIINFGNMRVRSVMSFYLKHELFVIKSKLWSTPNPFILVYPFLRPTIFQAYAP